MAILIEKYFTIVVHNLIQIGSTQDDSEDAQQRTVAGVEWGRCRDFGNSAPSVEIRSPSMRVFPNRASQAVLGFSVVLPAILLMGCGNSCFVAVSNNGSGSVLVKVGDPPPVCSLHPATGMVQAVAQAKRVCEACPAPERVEHIFVTVRGVEIHASMVADSNSPDWIEVAPEFERAPRQVDLMAAGASAILSEVLVTAGVYREMRVRFVTNELEKMTGENVCGVSAQNCLVMGDGRVEPLQFSAETAVLRLQLESGQFVILPDAQNRLRMDFEPVPLGLALGAEGMRVGNGLAGRVRVAREAHLGVE